MSCFTAQPRIRTEDLAKDITLEEGEFQITWGQIWGLRPGYPLQLSEQEMWWRDRFNMLERRGYRLLPRYSPNWKPSWIKPYDSDPFHTAQKAKLKPYKYEDAIAISSGGHRIRVMFATRLLDGAQVVIKLVWRLESGFNEELKTMLLVSSEDLRDDPMNHCIQLLEWFPVEDDVEPELGDDRFAFTIMPLLREWRQPSFRLTMESLDFIFQLLEGLVFMHQNNIAHRDIRSHNIGMDPATMFPAGMNPLVNLPTFSGSSRGPREPRDRKDRIDVPVKYLYFDFGESLSFPSFEERRIACSACSFHAYPEKFEFKEELPEGQETWHDPFPADIYVMGTVLEESFYKDLPFMRPLIDSMLHMDPKSRPTAMRCLERFQDAKSRLNRWTLLSPASNMLHPYYGYEHPWHWVKDVTGHRYEYLRLVGKAALTRKGQRAVHEVNNGSVVPEAEGSQKEKGQSLLPAARWKGSRHSASPYAARGKNQDEEVSDAEQFIIEKATGFCSNVRIV